MSAPREQKQEHGQGGAAFWILMPIGLAVVGFGVLGLLRNVHGPALRSFLTFLIGGLIAHDALIAAATALVMLAVVRLLPTDLRGPVGAGLVLSAVLALVAIPVVGGWGRLPNNASLLPRAHYGRDLLAVLGAVWAVVLAVALVRWRRRRPRTPVDH